MLGVLRLAMSFKQELIISLMGLSAWKQVKPRKSIVSLDVAGIYEGFY